MEFHGQTYFNFEDTVNVFGNITEIMVYEIVNEKYVLVNKTKVNSYIIQLSIDIVLNSLILFTLYNIILTSNNYSYFNQSSNITISTSNHVARSRTRYLVSDTMNVNLLIDMVVRDYGSTDSNSTIINILIYCYCNIFNGNESTDGCTAVGITDKETSNFEIIANIILLTQSNNLVLTNIPKYSNTFVIITINFTIIMIYWSYIKYKTRVPEKKLWLQFPNDKLIQINCCKINSILVYFNICGYCMESSVIVNIHRYFYFFFFSNCCSDTIYNSHISLFICCRLLQYVWWRSYYSNYR